MGKAKKKKLLRWQKKGKPTIQIPKQKIPKGKYLYDLASFWREEREEKK